MTIHQRTQSTINDLQEKDRHFVCEIIKYLSVLPDPLIIIRLGSGKQFKKTIIKAGYVLTNCIQHVLSKTTYDDIYHMVLFDFIDVPKTDAYKAKIREELNKN